MAVNLDYGIEQASTPTHVEQERSAATALHSEAVQNGIVDRVTYGNRTVEVPAINHQALGRPVDKQYERNHASVLTRLRKIGVHRATVINFLPIPLRSDSCLDPLRVARIPAPKDGEEFTAFIFTDAFIEPARMGADSPLLAFEHHPTELAEEFSRIYPSGVFNFIGIPRDLTNEAWLNSISEEPGHGGKTYGVALEECRQKAVAWMQEQIRHGNDNDRQKRAPSEPQKAAARRLFHLGFIKELPGWVEKQRDLALKIPMCPKCQRASEPGAVQCTNMGCGYIIDPRRAYEIQAIGEDDLSLERLTRAEVTEMGLTDYVAETIDEKRSRLEIGAPKPISLAAMRLKASEDEYQDSQRNQNAAVVADAVVKASRKQKEDKG
jgi:hypothetical protein